MKSFLVVIVFSLPALGYAQPVQFTKDAIPVINGKVVFEVDFETNLKKEDLRNRAYTYLNDVLDPYAGLFSVNNDQYTVCRITDYVPIEASIFQMVGMYMTYNVQLTYSRGSCMMVIDNITYMEKKYFEAQEESPHQLHIPVFTGKAIMIDKEYALMLTRNASEKLTTASLNRINEVIAHLYEAFTKK